MTLKNANFKPTYPVRVPEMAMPAIKKPEPTFTTALEQKVKEEPMSV